MTNVKTSRTVRTKVYKFAGLSKEAKQKAIDQYLQNEDFFWVFDEAWRSLKKFAAIFDINLDNYDFLEPYRSTYQFNISDNVEFLSGQRLATWIWNNHKYDLFKGKYYGKLVKTFKDGSPIPVSKEHPVGMRHVRRYSKCVLNNDCVLTGTYYDMTVLGPIYKFLSRPGKETLSELFEECLSEVNKAVEAEIKACSTEEYLEEHFEANEYEFLQDGTKY